MFFIGVERKGQSFFFFFFFHKLSLSCQLSSVTNWWWCGVFLACFLKNIFIVLFKDRKSFTAETVSSTPSISRSSSISGVDMAGLQTSFLSQVYINNIGFLIVFFFFFFLFQETLLMLKMTLQEYTGFRWGKNF